MPTSDEVPLIAAPRANRLLAPAVFDAWDRGAAVLPLNPTLPAAQLRALLDHARPTHLLDDDGLTVCEGGVPVPSDTAAIVCTSGTTGAPKAVELTRTGL